MNKKEAEITKTKFKAKSSTILETGTSKKFNDFRIIIKHKSIISI